MPDTHELPPPCPECTGDTSLKEVHRHYPSEKYIFFFKCGDCAVEFPRVVGDEHLNYARSSSIRIPGSADKLP